MSECPSPKLDGQQWSHAAPKDHPTNTLSNVSQPRTPSQGPHDWPSSQSVAVSKSRRRDLQGINIMKSVQDEPDHVPMPLHSLSPKVGDFDSVPYLGRASTGRRLFVCGICGKAVVRRRDRERHERLHWGNKELICRGILSNGNPWGCGRRFTRGGTLSRHFRSENGRVCLKPLIDDEISQCNPEGSMQEHLTDLDSNLPRGEDFRFPASLLAQYPALAQMNWEEDVSTVPEENVSEQSMGAPSINFPSVDSGYISGPATDLTMFDCDILLPIANQPSSELYDRMVREFATRFSRRLSYRSGAHAWGESVLASLDFGSFASHLNSILTTYLFDSENRIHLMPYLSPRDLINQTEEICLQFYVEIKSGRSNLEVIPANIEAVEGLAEQKGAGSIMSSPVGGGHELSQLQNFLRMTDELVSGTSFESFSRFVREKLYSAPSRSMDHVRDALQVVSAHNLAPGHLFNYIPASILSGSSGTVVQTHLTLVDYVKKNFSDHRVELSTLVTITGTAFYAYATTCLDYLKQTWPDTGEILLPILQEAIRKALDQPDSTARVVKKHNLSREVSTELYWDGTLKLRVQGPEAFFVDIIQQLCWLTTAFTSPPLDEDCGYYCVPTLERISNSNLAEKTFKLKTSFTRLHASERNSCWLSLFSNAVIAHGFPIPERAEGMGLEMSVELMAAIIGARHAATFDGGIVIKGFSSIFVPVGRTTHGIQWHYVANSDPDSQLSYEEGVKQCSNRMLLPDLDFASLTKARCFIGWNGLVEIRVGDETNDFDSIEFSDAAEVKAALQIPSASLGFQQFGLAQIDVTFGKRDGKCHFQRNSSYRRIVSASERMFVALFDTGERRSCLVPASGLLLHILRHRVSSGLGGVPASKVKIPSAQSFTETLLNNAKLRLTPEEDEPLFVDEVVSEIWSILELLQAQGISAEKNSKLEIHATWQERLLGYEYKAVVEDWSPMPLKELEIHKTCGGWPKLVRDINALVLFANGFGDLIRPIDNQTSLCHQWKTLPRDKDYMAVPVKVLLSLYSLAGCRESKKRLTATNLQLYGRGLFQPCPTPKEWQCSCDRLQKVISNSSFGPICVPELIEGDGAVIIGESGSLLKRFSKRSTPKNTGVNGNTKTVSDGEISASWNSDTSRSSTVVESSDFRHSNTSSPASSVDDDSGVSSKAFEGMRAGLFNFRHRGKRCPL